MCCGKVGRSRIGNEGRVHRRPLHPRRQPGLDPAGLLLVQAEKAGGVSHVPATLLQSSSLVVLPRGSDSALLRFHRSIEIGQPPSGGSTLQAESLRNVAWLVLTCLARASRRIPVAGRPDSRSATAGLSRGQAALLECVSCRRHFDCTDFGL
jgi:hypothetical protein